MGQRRPKVVVAECVECGLDRLVQGRRPGVLLTLAKGCISICVLHRLHRLVWDREGGVQMSEKVAEDLGRLASLL